MAFCAARLSHLKLARVPHKPVRLFSVAISRVRPISTKQNVFRPSQPSRNYFWYPTKRTEAPTNPIPIDEASPMNTSVDASVEVVDPPPVQADTLADTSEATSITAITDIPPLQYGDLAELGLISWTPAGFVRWSLELIQVTTGLPWFHTIIVTTLLYRVILMPLGIQSLRNSARLLPMTPRMNAVKAEMTAAQKAGDMLGTQRALLKQKQIYKDAGVNMGPMILNPFVQLPVTLGLFFGVKKMCTLPVMQLKQSGLDVLPDLTVPDPFFVLPVLATALINLQISVGSKEMNIIERPEMGHVMNLFRIVSVLGTYFMGMLPSGVLVTLIASIAASALQSSALQYKPLRRALKIPIVPPHQQGRLPTFQQSFQAVARWFKQQQIEAHKVAARKK